MTRQQRFVRFAALGLAVTVLTLTVISFLGAASTRSAAVSVVNSTALSDAYARAKSALAAEESLERKYRLEPGAGVRARHLAAGGDLSVALADVHARGGAEDDALVGLVLREHSSYRTAIAHMFAAVDRGDTAESLRIDGAEVDPSFDLINGQVGSAAADHAGAAAAALVRLRRTESLVYAMTVAGFAAGLAMVGMFGMVVLSYQRDLLRQSALNRHQATHDALTGLPNRALFADRVEQALRTANRTGLPLSVMLVDLDRFKEVNDTLGHHFGDLLLRQVGPRVQSALRESDTLARLAGDEFAGLLPDSDEAAALAVAARVLAALHTSFTLEELTIDLEASIGVAVAPAHGLDADALLRHADIAMYGAKEIRGGIAVYDPDTPVHTPGRLLLLGDLRRALSQRDELFLHYQPKIELVDQTLCGVEALLRWQHPDRGLVQPVEFIPAAENTGLINRLTLHVLTLAVAQLRIWLDAGHALPVAVNLSARCLHDVTFPAQVAQLLLTQDVPARLLRLEVTETAIMADTSRALTVLNALHDLGVRLSIDDYGTGYSSMAYLKQLPVDEIKIDRSFVHGMTSDRNDAAIVRGAVDLGHNLNLTVVAEGVETAGQVEALTSLSCDIAQGFYYARPMPPEEISGWLTDGIPAGTPLPAR